MIMKVEIKLLGDIVTKAPSYATSGAAAVDLQAALKEPLKLAPFERAAVPTGIAIALPEGYEGQVRPRSGLAMKHGISITNGPGTIDSDYRAEIGVLLINLGSEPYVINPGDRIAQLVIAPVTQAEFIVVETLSETDRGSGGFGSTGV